MSPIAKNLKSYDFGLQENTINKKEANNIALLFMRKSVGNVKFAMQILPVNHGKIPMNH